MGSWHVTLSMTSSKAATIPCKRSALSRATISGAPINLISPGLVAFHRIEEGRLNCLQLRNEFPVVLKQGHELLGTHRPTEVVALTFATVLALKECELLFGLDPLSHNPLLEGFPHADYCADDRVVK